MPGKEGMLHISEISNERIENIDSVLKLGQVVTVRLVETDPATGKYRLSIRQVNGPAERTGGPSGPRPGGSRPGGSRPPFRR